MLPWHASQRSSGNQVTRIPRKRTSAETPPMRDIHLPGRSTVYGTGAAAATSQPLATLAAIDTLRAGGNALDAAISACAVQCVTEPNGTGIGGDCFAMYWINSERRLVAINGSGHAPAALTLRNGCWRRACARSQGIASIPSPFRARSMPGVASTPITVVYRWPKSSTAIRYADAGFAVGPCIATEWAAATQKLARNPNTARSICATAGAPSAGDRWRPPQLAETLRAIATNGRDAFYRGPVAHDMVTSLRGLGGVHTLKISQSSSPPTYAYCVQLSRRQSSSRCRPTGRARSAADHEYSRGI